MSFGYSVLGFGSSATHAATVSAGLSINDTSVEGYDTSNPMTGDTVTVTNTSSGASTVTYAFSDSDDDADVLTRSNVMGGATPAFFGWKSDVDLSRGADVSVSSGTVTESGTWYFKCEVVQTGTDTITLTQTCDGSITATVTFDVTAP